MTTTALLVCPACKEPTKDGALCGRARCKAARWRRIEKEALDTAARARRTAESYEDEAKREEQPE